MFKIGFDRWVELILAAAIAGATIWNVCVANRQWSAMQETNRISTRPYIKVTLKPESFLVHTEGSSSDDRQSVKFKLKNYGKLPGLVWAQSGANWNGSGHPADDKKWPSIGVMGRKFLFPDEEAEFVSASVGLTKGQLTDVATGDRFYVMVDALYGPSENVELRGPSRDYETKVCTVFPMKRTTSTTGPIIVLGWEDGGEPCPSDGSNYAK